MVSALAYAALWFTLGALFGAWLARGVRCVVAHRQEEIALDAEEQACRQLRAADEIIAAYNEYAGDLPAEYLDRLRNKT